MAEGLVGVAGFEPATPSSRTRCDAGLPLNDQRFSKTSDPICSRSLHAKLWPTFGRKNTAPLPPRRSSRCRVMAAITEREVFRCRRPSKINPSPDRGSHSLNGQTLGCWPNVNQVSWPLRHRADRWCNMSQHAEMSSGPTTQPIACSAAAERMRAHRKRRRAAL
jgi:hypothetical protein